MDETTPSRGGASRKEPGLPWSPGQLDGWLQVGLDRWRHHISEVALCYHGLEVTLLRRP